MRGPALLIALCLAAVGGGCASDPPGREDFEIHCGICHPLDNVLARRKDRAGWVRTVEAMRQRGADLTDDQARRVVEYLAAVRPAK